ncbi:MAG: hypothetical protein AABY68_12610 [Pseudomonadota bacterium]
MRVQKVVWMALASALLAACGTSTSESESSSDKVVGSSTAALASANQSQPDERDCLWALSSNAVNTQLPDTNANYWVAVLPIPPGGSVEFQGDFPHGRYMSFNLYNAFLQPIDALSDVELQPGIGASNPYLPGADRDASERGYRVSLVAGAVPEQRAPNTLYSAQTLGPVQLPTNLAVVLYRTYVPDAGLGPTGGTGLPHIIFRNADGTAVSGLQACNEPSVLEAVVPNVANIPDPIANVPLNTAAYENLLWLKFYDVQSAQASRLYNTPLGPVVYQAVGSPTSGAGGFLSNRDNRYIYSAIFKGLGDIVVLHGKFPTTPKTSDGNARMGTGDMRYWSLCTNDGNTTAVYSCIYDEQLVRQADGRGVVVVSKPEDRPSNATAACGVTWLNWGSADTSLLLLRNMLPLPKEQFPHAVQYIEGAPGENEAKVMGPYYPYGNHMMRTAFEGLGCPISPDQFASVVTPPPS